jgi:hypothetical protein
MMESTSTTAKQRPHGPGDGAGRENERSEKPPESAEDFEHVLRRLISARDAGRSSGRQP